MMLWIDKRKCVTCVTHRHMGNSVGVFKMEKTTLEMDVERMETAEDMELVLEAVKEIGFENLSLMETQTILMNRELADGIREIVEASEREKKVVEVYKRLTGDTEAIFTEKTDMARFVLAVEDCVRSELGNGNRAVVNVEKKDDRGRKPPVKLAECLVDVFKGKQTLNLENIVDGLCDRRYSAENPTKRLYITWSVSWGILNLNGGLYSINKPNMREIFNL